MADANLKAQGEWQSRADAYKGKFEQAQIHFSIMAASSEAVSPDFVKDYLAGKAVCDEEGNVTIDGNTVADTVKSLLDKHPFLAKAQGGTGSGAGSSVEKATPSVVSMRHRFGRGFITCR